MTTCTTTSTESTTRHTDRWLQKWLLLNQQTLDNAAAITPHLAKQHQMAAVQQAEFKRVQFTLYKILSTTDRLGIPNCSHTITRTAIGR